MAAAITIRASDAMKSMTLDIKFTGARTLAWRLWLAAQVMKVAAKIAGCGVRIDTSRNG